MGLDELKNKIHHCDYLEMLRQIPDESADLVLTDPPYGINYSSNANSNKHEVLANDAERFSYEPVAREAMRILKPNCAAYFFTGWSVYPEHFADVKRSGLKMQPPLIIQKHASVLGNVDGAFANNAEWAIHATKGKFEFRETNLIRNRCAGGKHGVSGNTVAEFKNRLPSCWFGPEYPQSIEDPSFQDKYRHPTPKNLTMMVWLIKLSTDEGGLVVDPFSGSGTTAAASILTHRDFIVSEINPEYVAVGRRRISRSHIGGFF